MRVADHPILESSRPVARTRPGSPAHHRTHRPPPDALPEVAPSPHRVCDACGHPARIDILDGYTNGSPARRYFCLTCAALSFPAHLDRDARLRLSTLAALAAFAVLSVGLFGDFLAPAGNAGFGWHQQIGIVIGVLTTLFGLLLRAELITLAGAFLFGVSLSADWFGLTHGPGIGWKQQWMIAAGLLVLCAAALARTRHRLRSTFSRRLGARPATGTCHAGQLAAE